jgi:hypothetical protein
MKSQAAMQQKMCENKREVTLSEDLRTCKRVRRDRM